METNPPSSGSESVSLSGSIKGDGVKSGIVNADTRLGSVSIDTDPDSDSDPV